MNVRRFCRYGLRTLLIVVSAGALVLGWMYWNVDQTRRQLREERAALEQVGRGASVSRRPVSPGYLSFLLSDSERGEWKTVVELEFPPLHRNAGKCLENVGAFRHLERVTMDICLGTDEALDHLQAATSVKSLSLFGSDVTDKGLAHLIALQNLEELAVNRVVHLTDNGLKPIGTLENLQSLKLESTNITDSGVRYLHNTKLRSVDLRNTNVADGAVRHLAQICPGLRELRLSDTNVSGIGLERFRQLEVLTASGPQMASLALVDMPQMQNVAVDGPALRAKFHNLPRLETLQWDGLAIDCRDLPVLKELWIYASTQRVILDRVGVETLVMGCRELKVCRLEGLTQLRTCLLDWSNVQSEQLRSLRGAPNLRMLTLRHCGLTDDIGPALAELSQVTILALDGNPITDASLEQLADEAVDGAVGQRYRRDGGGHRSLPRGAAGLQGRHGAAAPRAKIATHHVRRTSPSTSPSGDLRPSIPYRRVRG